MAEVQAVMVIAGTVTSGAYAGWRYVVRPHAVEPARAFFGRVNDAFARLDALQTDVADIKTAVGENGGKSLADKVGRIDLMVRTVHARQAGLAYSVVRAVFETDAEGRWIEANRAFLDLVGASREDVLGAGWVNLVHGPDREHVKAAWDDAIRDRRDFREPVTYDGRNGLITVSVEARPTRDPVTRAIVGWWAIVRPVDESQSSDAGGSA